MNTNNKDDLTYLRLSNKRRKKYRRIEGILKEWYGNEMGKSEVSSYLPKTVSLKEALDDLIAKNLGPNEHKLMRLKKNWAKLMGEQVNKISKPVSLKNKILKIEVENSAWLMELKNFHGRIIEKKIKDSCGNKFCNKIIYTVKGTNR